MDIGRLGFVQSLGLLIFSPLAGYALDHNIPVFGPLLVTATCCSFGCLWRGIATSVTSLYIAAGLLSIGVNLWTVVLLQVSHCTSRDHRSHVLSGYAVQETGLRLLGKAVFPFWDFLVRAFLLRVPQDYKTTLLRYRIHMGICTVFCLFGTVALLVERRALQQSSPVIEIPSPPRPLPISATSSSLEIGLASPENKTDFKPSQLKESRSPVHPRKSNFLYVAILSALLIQSWSSTVLAVLWPLVLRDQFQFAATEYGVVVVVASICSTGAVATFPTVEHHFGRIKTAAMGATISCLACFMAFVILPNLMHSHAASEEDETNPDAVPLEPNDSDLFLIRQTLLVHVILAVVFEASVRTLEPSLKSILSLTVPVSAQNRSLGFMSTLGGLGGMGGNLMGTWLFHQSNELSGTGVVGLEWLRNGTLPFVAVAGVLALASVFLWTLEWEESRYHKFCVTEETQKNFCVEDPSAEITGTETQHDRLIFPLMQKDTSYETKLD